MNGLEARWPGMRDRLCDTTPAIDATSGPGKRKVESCLLCRSLESAVPRFICASPISSGDDAEASNRRRNELPQ